MDTLGNLPLLKVTAANEQERSLVAELAKKIQDVTGGTAEIAFVDQGYARENTAQQARDHGIKLEVMKHQEAEKGFALFPCRWVVELAFGWLGRFRRLARDYDRPTDVLAGWRWLAFLVLIIKQIGFLK